MDKETFFILLSEELTERGMDETRATDYAMAISRAIPQESIENKSSLEDDLQIMSSSLLEVAENLE